MDYASYALCSVKAFKLVKPCELLRPIKPDFAVCAADFIKLVVHFLQLKNSREFDHVNYFHQ